ncbi:hypothetical protein QBC47DRAFT_365954 [Echria macrotheca]|uniref:Secreted protein n=1 Tax=Echria macrotheca TaxID=438768 RepID=A0AAJ0F5Z9_9PEZI|nr:hypothetical protein QBC47DRAFT_365954 [Echria macrotheca]
MFVSGSVVLGAIVACLTLGASASAVPEERRSTLQTRAWVGPVDVEKACQVQLGEDWHAKTVGSGCYDWRCQNGRGEQKGVNMHEACVSQYSLNQCYGSCKNGVYNWSCNYDL